MARRIARRLAVLTVLVPLVAAGSAVARVPTFKPKTIVPGKSIGGVAVGMTKARAVSVWGKPDLCDKKYRPGVVWCQYKAASTTNGTTVVQPFAGFFLRSGKVVSVELDFAENSAIDPKLKRVKTSKGIALGSQMSKARSAYGIAPASGGEAGRSRALLTQGKLCTLFYAPNSPFTVIDAIQVGRCNAQAGLF